MQVISQRRCARGGYGLFPAFRISGRVGNGFAELARRLTGGDAVRIDGYVGVDWAEFRARLQAELMASGVGASWFDVTNAWRSPPEIARMVVPFVAGDDPLFGTRYRGTLSDFIDWPAWERLSSEAGDGLAIFYGCGAALIDRSGPLLYVDLPKDELQRRSSLGLARNLGAEGIASPKQQYKRFYFVDWPVLNRHKAAIVTDVDVLVDGQRAESVTFIDGEEFRTALDDMSRNVFRVRPWFAPGPWGGQWLKRHVPDAPQDVPNYAWSFELITPENSIALSDGDAAVEASFDWLMYYRHRAVLGDAAERFGHEFPIRFDFLDTIDGGNLSLQCHPRPDYIRAEFGETFTQDETYYIVDCQAGARVFLGFRRGVDPGEFRSALEKSARDGTPLDVERFVATHSAARHDLFLIPHGTVHCSGAGNLVLEISATPYIFTFKMYDWLRSDLDGRPRPLNIDRAFDNLDFTRQGERVELELISRPSVLSEGDTWRLVHLPTHPDHFYDVHRYEFEDEAEGETAGSPHVLMQVEGTSVRVETQCGMTQRFHFAETFVVPAAAQSYRLINEGVPRAKVVKAFIKPESALRG